MFGAVLLSSPVKISTRALVAAQVHHLVVGVVPLLVFFFFLRRNWQRAQSGFITFWREAGSCPAGVVNRIQHYTNLDTDYQ